MNRRGPGLLGAVARTAVVAGTASAVSGRVRQHQQEKFAGQEAEQAAQAQAAQQQPAAPAAPADDTISRLERLAGLKTQGILTEEEFAAEKAKILSG
ncbi:SHOCT domain-containing protein [Streptomyces sp. SID13666]|uniref:SHOCT domain-containing protein n=1 Tax=unclassified Streptomyces TaxID=2593676 RepID=UPI0013BF9A0C|nr:MULTISPECIES: SHOCT domain-containing protein [unclassified Streptomyces]NEA58465.1 SHOCT domain-containing protein [Streptomyces sp. SID13666]NEA72546.1 SHOCT domain-containing protein [Streptomyces sp. SID13588]